MEIRCEAVEMPVAFAVQYRTSTAVHHIVEDGELSAVLQFECYKSSGLSQRLGNGEGYLFNCSLTTGSGIVKPCGLSF